MSNQLIKILCVEDSEADREIVARCLEKTRLVQCALTPAATAEEALALLEKTPFDFALVDYKLPDIDGVELTRRVIEDFPGTRVIMLTGLGDEKIAVEAMKAGASDYIIKDELRSTALPRAINSIIEREEREEEERRLKEAETLIDEQRRVIEGIKGETRRREPSAREGFADDPDALQEWTAKYLDVFKSYFGTRGGGEGSRDVERFADALFDSRLNARDIMEIHLQSLEMLFEEEIRFTGHQEARIILLKLLAGLVDRYQQAAN